MSGLFLLLLFNLNQAIILNTCILGLSHLVRFNRIFKLIYMTYDLIQENNNTIVVLIENSKLRVRGNRWADC